MSEQGHVLDACALIALLRNEPGADRIAEMLAGGDTEALIHALNVCEVYYDALRRDAEFHLDALLAAISEVGLTVVYDLPPLLLERAGRLKAERRRISLADCVALGLALERNRRLVTTDHHEFDPLAAEGFPIVFAR